MHLQPAGRECSDEEHAEVASKALGARPRTYGGASVSRVHVAAPLSAAYIQRRLCQPRTYSSASVSRTRIAAPLVCQPAHDR